MTSEQKMLPHSEFEATLTPHRLAVLDRTIKEAER
jgi:hypothetical protein